MSTVATMEGDFWVINGQKTWNTGVDHASHDLVFARCGGRQVEVADELFCLRQLAEKQRGWNRPLCALKSDVLKAFDTIVLRCVGHAH